MIESGMTWNGGVFSHFPFLALALDRTAGAVLECGAGWGSTPLIHYLSEGRRVMTVETNADWLKPFEPYKSDSHVFIELVIDSKTQDQHHGLISHWEKFALKMAERQWGVVFLDQSPGEARVPCAIALKNSATYIVCHDTEADIPPSGGNYGWAQLDSHFKFKRTVKRIRPWTTIYSNIQDFPLEACDE